MRNRRPVTSPNAQGGVGPQGSSNNCGAWAAGLSPCFPMSPASSAGFRQLRPGVHWVLAGLERARGQPRVVPAEERVAGVLEGLQHRWGLRPDEVAAIERGLPCVLEPPLHLCQVSAHLVPPEPAHDSVDGPQSPATPPRQGAPPGLWGPVRTWSGPRQAPSRSLPTTAAGLGSPSALHTALERRVGLA